MNSKTTSNTSQKVLKTSNKYILAITLVMLLLTTGTMAQNIPSYLPSNGLVGWWPFNGNANDESGNGNDGLIDGPQLIGDRNGSQSSAFEFDGINDRITIGQFNNPPIANVELTFSGWIKTNANNTESMFIIGARGNGPTALVLQPGEQITCTYATLGGGFHNLDTYTINVKDNNWHNLTMTYQNQTMRLFVDGILINESIQSMSLLVNGLLEFGRDYPYDRYFSGSIDDIAIYNRALTPEEITSIYTSEPINPPTACNPLPTNLQNGLVGFWPFCGNANDESGNGNDGTVNGASLTTDRFENSNSAFQSGLLTPLVSVPNININSGLFTCSYWVKYSSNPINTSIADVSHEWIGNGTFTTFRQLNSNIGFAAAGSNGVDDQTIIYSNNSIDTSTWNHIVVMRNNQLMEIWVNGLKVASDYLVQNGNLTSSKTFYIGGDPVNTAQNPLAKFNGKIDDIGIWNRTLTLEEIQQLYTINACTFTIYDTVTVTQTVYDTVTTFTSVTDTLIINTLITELAPPSNTNTIKVFPNPAGSVLTIDYGNFALMNGYQLRIENSLGQQVFQTNINQESETLTLNNWGGNGLYFVHIIDPQGNTIDIRKIVLQ